MDTIDIPRKCGVAREVLKWVQSLDLTYTINNIKRDFSNGFLVAEIFSWYYPQDIQMHSYDNGTSLPTKLGNWSQLQRFFVKKNLEIPKGMIDGTIHCKIGAAELLLHTIYTLLANRLVRILKSEEEVDFTDRHYQTLLPMHARSTASQAIKNNLKITECMTEPNIITNKQKAHAIISRHLEHRSLERLEDPKRFNIKPTVGELAVRVAPPQSPGLNDVEQKFNDITVVEDLDERPTKSSSVQFREINVQQMNKASQMAVKPGTIHTVQTPVFTH